MRAQGASLGEEGSGWPLGAGLGDLGVVSSCQYRGDRHRLEPDRVGHPVEQCDRGAALSTGAALELAKLSLVGLRRRLPVISRCNIRRRSFNVIGLVVFSRIMVHRAKPAMAAVVVGRARLHHLAFMPRPAMQHGGCGDTLKRDR